MTDRAAAALARLGFAEPERAAGELAALSLWDGGGPVDDGARRLVDAVGAAANPDLALAGLSRLVAAAPKPAVLVAALRSEPGLRARLVGVLGTSAALADHLALHPTDWPLLADDVLMRSRPTAYALRVRLLEAAAADEPVAALRDAYRAALLALAARDVAEGTPVEDVAGELADLASATLDAALAIAARDAPGELAVVALGKCGGRELNYVSDVDVVFVAPDDADLAASTRLAEGLIRVCGEVAWQVDAGLRPEGRSGPLVRTLASHEAYYRRWARTWEFQALLKARPVAGDLALGRRYVKTVTPLIWTAERPDLVAETQAMKRRVEASVPAAQAGRQLKLGPGGLRDVEFAVQLLQLVHGRTDESLRSGNTLTALAALGAGGYVGPEDAAALGAAYRFLRKVEHRLQLQRLRRTHVLPADPDGMRWLARATGFRDEEAFRATYDGSARQVRRLHEKLFYAPLLTAVARLPADAIRLTPEAAAARLDALGFANPQGALRHLEAVTTGLSRRAQVLRAMLPVMLPWFAEAHDPDAGLLAFRGVAEAVGDSPWFLALLRDDENSAQRLARLLASSRYVGDLLARAPEAVATVVREEPRRGDLRAELAAVAARSREPATATASLRALRRAELLRIASADLLGSLDVRAVGEALTDAAEATLAAAFDVASRAVGQSDARIAVVGMGRLGGREQGYGSDADVLFVHEPLPGASEPAAAAAAKAVAEELRRLLALPFPDPPLLVDADLRPEGRQGPLSLSLAGYARYYERRAAVWEAQALLRARPVAGDPALGEAFLELVAPVRWPARFEGSREVRRIKARVEAERMPRGVDRHRHTKLGPGGLADVEWTVQLLQLQHASAVEALRTTSTLDALAAAADAGLLDPADAGLLAEGWRAATRARNAIVLVRGRASDVLPDDVRALAGIARAVGYPAHSQAEFLDAYRRATRRARSVVERVFYA